MEVRRGLKFHQKGFVVYDIIADGIQFLHRFIWTQNWWENTLRAEILVLLFLWTESGFTKFSFRDMMQYPEKSDQRHVRYDISAIWHPIGQIFQDIAS